MCANNRFKNLRDELLDASIYANAPDEVLSSLLSSTKKNNVLIIDLNHLSHKK